MSQANTQSLVTVTQREIFQRCWKISFDAGLPTGSITVEREANGNKVTKTEIQLFKSLPFASYKQAARRACLGVGVSFDGGYLVPEEKVDNLIKEIVKNGEEYLAGVPDFLQDWAKACEDEAIAREAAGEVELASRIRAVGAEKMEEMQQSSLHFRVYQYRVEPTQCNNPAMDGFSHKISGLTGQIAHEISQMVSGWTGKASQHTRGTILAVRAKVEGLAFIAPKVSDLLEVIDSVLSKFPPKGALDGEPYYLVMGLMAILSDPERILGDHSIPIPDLVPVAQAVQEAPIPAAGTDLFAQAADQTEVVTAQAATPEVISAPSVIEPTPASSNPVTDPSPFPAQEVVADLWGATTTAASVQPFTAQPFTAETYVPEPFTATDSTVPVPIETNNWGAIPAPFTPATAPAVW